jgi:hypothetical protein
MRKKTTIQEPFVPDYPDITVCGKDEYIVSWRISDWNLIHRIQDYFNMPRYTSLNRLSKIKIKQNDPKYEDLRDGIRKGLFWVYQLPNVSKS